MKNIMAIKLSSLKEDLDKLKTIHNKEFIRESIEEIESKINEIQSALKIKMGVMYYYGRNGDDFMIPIKIIDEEYLYGMYIELYDNKILNMNYDDEIYLDDIVGLEEVPESKVEEIIKNHLNLIQNLAKVQRRKTKLDSLKDM